MTKYPENTLILTVDPFVGFMPNELRAWLCEHTDDASLAAALAAVDKLMERNVIFEINTGAMAKGWKSSPYPAPWILKYIASKGGSVIINSDCHKAEFLDFGFDEALALAKSCGVNVLSHPPLKTL